MNGRGGLPAERPSLTRRIQGSLVPAPAAPTNGRSLLAINKSVTLV